MKFDKILIAATLLGGASLAMTATAASATATFQVKLTITKACAVTAGAGSNIDLGTTDTAGSNIVGSNTIAVTCSKTTPYFIGLAPSNSDTGGAGVLHGAIAGNTDTVAYQLRQTAGLSGTAWGNTATALVVGNGQGGTGTGISHAHTVFATVPSVNVTPDTYTDIVTVAVNY